MPDADLPAYYDAADIFALPSIARTETFGVVQLEAMAAGRPVVSTDLPTGVPWVNQDGVSGLVVAPGDAAALAAAIARLGADAEPSRQAWSRRTQPCGVDVLNRPDGRCVQGRRRRRIEDAASRARGRRRAGGCAVSAKRLLDVLLSGAGLIASSPLWALIAAAIKLESPGPVFFTQVRVGEGGRHFDAIKFRSMVHDAEAGVGPVQATLRDPRITRVGRVLRATALDELPQLWNIFRGDMSFVGPRALRPNEIEPARRRPGSAARSGAWLHDALHGHAGPDRPGADLPPARRDAPPEVPLRPAVCPPAFLHARPAADPALVLDFDARPLGSEAAEVLMLDAISDSDGRLREGHYAAKQIFCRDSLIAWSHRRRFEVGLRLARRFSGKRILDYGCGDGTFLALLHAAPLAPAGGGGRRARRRPGGRLPEALCRTPCAGLHAHRRP